MSDRGVCSSTAPTITESEPGGCFPAGTEVLTVDGPRAIETVSPGTEVYGRDLVSGEWIRQKVRKVHTHRYTGDMITISPADRRGIGIGHLDQLVWWQADVEPSLSTREINFFQRSCTRIYDYLKPARQ